jgi:hypothetical protein
MLKKLVRRKMIFGHIKEGLTAPEMADLDKLAELIFTLSLMLQTKSTSSGRLMSRIRFLPTIG